jgi:hypothetical protein
LIEPSPHTSTVGRANSITAALLAARVPLSGCRTPAGKGRRWASPTSTASAAKLGPAPFHPTRASAFLPHRERCFLFLQQPSACWRHRSLSRACAVTASSCRCWHSTTWPRANAPAGSWTSAATALRHSGSQPLCYRSRCCVTIAVPERQAAAPVAGHVARMPLVTV